VPERLVISVCMASHGQTIVRKDSRHWAPGDVIISDGMPALKWHALQRTRELSIMLPRAVVAPGGGQHPGPSGLGSSETVRPGPQAADGACPRCMPPRG
jgi:hypothetical protein